MLIRPVQKIRRSLSLKLSIAVALVVLLTVGMMSVFAYVQDRRGADRRERASLQALSKDLAARIDLSLANGKILAAHLACTRDVLDFLGQGGRGAESRKTCQDWLDLQLRQTPGISSIFILSTTGECLASTNRAFIGHNYNFRPFFQEAMAGRCVLTDWLIGLVFRTPHIDASAPVRVHGKIAGILVTEFPVAEIEQAIRSAGAGGRSAVLINRFGIALSHSNPALQYHALKPLDAAALDQLTRTRQFMGRDIPVDRLSKPFADAFERVHRTSEAQVATYQVDGFTKLAALTPLMQEDWVVSVSLPQDEIYLPIRKAMEHTLLVGLLTASVGIVAAFALARLLLGPINRLSSAMERFGAGDPTSRAPVLVQDERGHLAQAFNHMADALQANQERVQELQAQKLESLGTLVAGVAHNLNNVLTVAMGTASLREGTVTDPADRQAYQNIGRVCRRGRDVVNSLIHFAQPASASQAPVELNTMIREVCALLESTAGNRIGITGTLTPESLWISGNPGDLTNVLVNLGVNALEAMPGGGILTFRTAGLADELVEVSVQDNGTGMDPEVLAHVLEPFYTTKEVGKGTGLGLSMAYGVVKAHGGTIGITSEPGMGTAVTLRFPRIPAPAPAGPSPDSTPEPSLAAMKVFLVDDEEDIRFLMTRVLRKAGAHQVKTFPCGEEALATLRSGERPDLIILDQNMPGMNGIQTMEQIRGLHPEMPILICSGQPDIGNWECFQRPGVAVISKPFTMDEIQSKLARFSGDRSGR